MAFLHAEGQGMSGRVAALMPRLTTELADLVAIRSVSEVGYPAATRPALLEARDMVARLFESAGCGDVRSLELPDTAPIVMGEIPAPEGAPTVLLYSHYDVVGPGDESEWRTPPFEADGARRRACTAAAPPTPSRTSSPTWARCAPGTAARPSASSSCIEGQEEVGGGALLGYPAQHPELFAADVVIIGDMGSVRPGVPDAHRRAARAWPT